MADDEYPSKSVFDRSRALATQIGINQAFNLPLKVAAGQLRNLISHLNVMCLGALTLTLLLLFLLLGRQSLSASMGGGRWSEIDQALLSTAAMAAISVCFYFYGRVLQARNILVEITLTVDANTTEIDEARYLLNALDP